MEQMGQGNAPEKFEDQYPISNIQYPMIKGGNRRGVALIVVLGFLSIMILMALAFLTQARMERMVADSTMEAMRGRQLVRTAVNAAMNDYSVYLWQQQLTMPVRKTDRVFSSVPPAPAFGLSGRTIGADGISLLTGEVYDWLPRRYLQDPESQQIVSNAEWILVRENPADNQSRILGRYAYACFDMSGGIDANLVARSPNVAAQDVRDFTNRVRHSVRDVPMGSLPETLDANEFKRLRKGWKGFDSLYSLIKLTDGKGEDGTGGLSRWADERKEKYGAGLSSNLVSDLVPYSLSAYRGGRYDRGSGEWTKPVQMLESTPWLTVLAPLNYQFANGWNRWIQDAIYDYTHDTAVPKGTDYPSPKNVPMFNEIDVTYRLEEIQDTVNATSSYKLILNVAFEFWYPFPSKDNEGAGTFQLNSPVVGGGISTSPTGPEDIWIRLWMMGPGGLALVKLVPPAGAPPAMHVDATWKTGNKPAQPVPTNFNYTLEIVAANGDSLPLGKQLMIQGLNVAKPIYLLNGGGHADMVPPMLSFPGALLMAGQEKTFAQAVTDPRLNHLRGAWVLEEPSLGEMNKWYTDPIKLATSGESSKTAAEDEGICMYCRNGPMETPGELGFISNGKEWGTIDLCTDAGAELLATLVSTNFYSDWLAGGGVVYTNGTINPNTRSTNVLISAFFDLAAGEVPNHPPERVSNPNYPESAIKEEVARHLATRITEETDTATIPVAERLSTTFQAGTDWARIQAMQKKKDLAKMGLNNNQRESLIRNTWGLFSPDNSLSTVVVIAQPIKEGPGNVGIWNASEDLITGERRAVALAWRDPFKTGQNLHHEMFVRMFRYLND
jgi:hypothetical protein